MQPSNGGAIFFKNGRKVCVRAAKRDVNHQRGNTRMIHPAYGVLKTGKPFDVNWEKTV